MRGKKRTIRKGVLFVPKEMPNREQGKKESWKSRFLDFCLGLKKKYRYLIIVGTIIGALLGIFKLVPFCIECKIVLLNYNNAVTEEETVQIKRATALKEREVAQRNYDLVTSPQFKMIKDQDALPMTNDIKISRSNSSTEKVAYWLTWEPSISKYYSEAIIAYNKFDSTNSIHNAQEALTRFDRVCIQLPRRDLLYNNPSLMFISSMYSILAEGYMTKSNFPLAHIYIDQALIFDPNNVTNHAIKAVIYCLSDEEESFAAYVDQFTKTQDDFKRWAFCDVLSRMGYLLPFDMVDEEWRALEKRLHLKQHLNPPQGMQFKIGDSTPLTIINRWEGFNKTGYFNYTEQQQKIEEQLLPKRQKVRKVATNNGDLIIESVRDKKTISNETFEKSIVGIIHTNKSLAGCGFWVLHQTDGNNERPFLVTARSVVEKGEVLDVNYKRYNVQCEQVGTRHALSLSVVLEDLGKQCWFSRDSNKAGFVVLPFDRFDIPVANPVVMGYQYINKPKNVVLNSNNLTKAKWSQLGVNYMTLPFRKAFGATNGQEVVVYSCQTQGDCPIIETNGMRRIARLTGNITHIWNGGNIGIKCDGLKELSVGSPVLVRVDEIDGLGTNISSLNLLGVLTEVENGLGMSTVVPVDDIVEILDSPAVDKFIDVTERQMNRVNEVDVFRHELLAQAEMLRTNLVNLSAEEIKTKTIALTNKLEKYRQMEGSTF